MKHSLKGQVLCAALGSGPDSWHVFFLVTDDRRLVMFGGASSFNDAGKVQREDCVLQLWDGTEKPYHYYL